MAETLVSIQPTPKTAEVASVEDSALILSMIDRLVANPEVDVDRVDKLFQLYERAQANAARRSYHAALPNMQAALPIITHRGKIKNRAMQVQSTYALWEDVVEEIQPVLHEHGFAISFRVSNPDDKMVVTGVLSHRDGHSEETSFTLPYDATGSKNAVQSIGSSASYGKRYTAQALTNFVTRGEDDDAQSANVEYISDEEQEILKLKAAEAEMDVAKFLGYFGLASWNEVKKSDFAKAKGIIEARIAENKKKNS